MSKYNEAILNELREGSPFTYDTAKAFGDAHGISFRSVIGKIRALGLEYEVKGPKRASTAKKSRSKADIVDAIVSGLGVELPSLNKMTVADLETLEKMIA